MPRLVSGLSAVAVASGRLRAFSGNRTPPPLLSGRARRAASWFALAIAAFLGWQGVHPAPCRAEPPPEAPGSEVFDDSGEGSPPAFEEGVPDEPAAEGAAPREAGRTPRRVAPDAVRARAATQR